MANSLRVRLADLNGEQVVGNAYSDHDLLAGYWDLAIAACEANDSDLAYESLDLVGTRVMGEPAYDWAEFVLCLTFWHKEGPAEC